jgi:pyrrolidone-carboxylate peptidase
MRKKFFLKKIVFIILCIYIGIIFIPVVNGTNCLKNLNKNELNISVSRKTIMLTGFWDPTGRMLTQFSTDPELNPEGWKGENWADLGYDIYSYFPKPGSYTGMFEVDYQDTWEDFWSVTEQIKPFAIISFGAGTGPWEIEYNARNLDSWINDDSTPYQPTPSPPDDTVPVNYVRHSTLPVQQIADAINKENIVEAWVDWDGNPGRYLCEYIAYLGMWYQSIHNQSSDPNPCRVAGFIHVNPGVSVEDATIAVEITIRETIECLYFLNRPPELPIITGPDEGKFGEEYDYKISTIDPDGDEIYYWIEWFQGCPGVNWEGPYNSGDEITKTHSWDEEGKYTIRVKAKDTNGAESDWATLEVNMPKIKEINRLFIEFLREYPIIYKLFQRIIRF